MGVSATFRLPFAFPNPNPNGGRGKKHRHKRPVVGSFLAKLSILGNNTPGSECKLSIRCSPEFVKRIGKYPKRILVSKKFRKPWDPKTGTLERNRHLLRWHELHSKYQQPLQLRPNIEKKPRLARQKRRTINRTPASNQRIRNLSPPSNLWICVDYLI